jgi:hypothetical protein
MEAELEKAEHDALSSEKILAAYVKAPDCEAVRETLMREKERLILSLKEIRRILGDLHRCGREELGRLRDENEVLKSKNRKLLIELRDSLGVNSALKDKDGQETGPAEVQRGNPPVRAVRPRGAPKGHRGNTRRIPGKWDEKIEVPPPGFCECGCRQILENGGTDRKYIEDIPPVSCRVTLVEYRRGVCVKCGKEIIHPETAGPAVEIGGNLSAHLAMLRQAGVSYRKLSAFCTETLGIPLSPSGAYGVVSRLTDKKLPLYETIGNALHKQELLHGDETGWKVRKEQWYVWLFCNLLIVFYHAEDSRASKVIRGILGEDFGGTVVCDFYAAYNFLPKTQRCLAHLMRDVEKEREILPGNAQLEQFEERLWNFIEIGKSVSLLPPGPDKVNAAALLQKELTAISEMDLPKGRPETLRKRIVKYQEEIFRFVETPGIEWHNNRAERHLRPLVVSRKMSFGSDTPDGARRTCALHSIIETCRLQNISPVELLRENMMKGFNDNSPLSQLLTSRLNC